MKATCNGKFVKACKNGNLAVLKSALEDSLRSDAAEPDQMFDINAAVITAAGNGHLDLVQHLVEAASRYENQVDFSERDSSALVQAASNGHLDVVQYLIEMKRVLQTPYLMADKHLAICVAVENRHVAVVKYLISNLP